MQTLEKTAGPQCRASELSGAGPCGNPGTASSILTPQIQPLQGGPALTGPYRGRGKISEEGLASPLAPWVMLSQPFSKPQPADLYNGDNCAQVPRLCERGLMTGSPQKGWVSPGLLTVGHRGREQQRTKAGLPRQGLTPGPTFPPDGQRSKVLFLGRAHRLRRGPRVTSPGVGQPVP